MRRDGSATYFKIEALLEVCPGRPEWSGIDLGNVLFADLSFEDKRGELGDRYREMLAPQQASSALWQRYGIHGFVEREDAEKVLRECRLRRPGTEFRLVRRTITQETEVVQAPITAEQVAQAMTDADEAFWRTLADALPQIETGDFPPDAHAAWWLAVRRAVACWVSGNMPVDHDGADGGFDQADEMARQIMDVGVSQ
jgi:hypothetical protein